MFMKWMKICKGTILVPLFFLFSCSGEEALTVEFPAERKAEWELVSDELYVNVVYGLWEYKSYLLVPVSDMKTGHNLWIYDKRTGKRIWSGINDGNGPGETIGGLRNTYFSDGVLTYYDDMKGSILRYQIDSIMAGSFLYKLDLIIASVIMMFISANTLEYVLGLFNRRKMVLIISERGEEVCEAILATERFGVTLLRGKGAYSGTDKEILLTITNNVALKRLENLVYSVDPRALFVVENTFYVSGGQFARRDR